MDTVSRDYLDTPDYLHTGPARSLTEALQRAGWRLIQDSIVGDHPLIGTPEWQPEGIEDLEVSYDPELGFNVEYKLGGHTFNISFFAGNVLVEGIGRDEADRDNYYQTTFGPGGEAAS